MSLVDTEHMRDLQGRTLAVGMTVRALRNSAKVGAVWDFDGTLVNIRKSDRPGRLEGLVQPFIGGEARWLGGHLIELPAPDSKILEGVLVEWTE